MCFLLSVVYTKWCPFQVQDVDFKIFGWLRLQCKLADDMTITNHCTTKLNFHKARNPAAKVLKKSFKFLFVWVWLQHTDFLRSKSGMEDKCFEFWLLFANMAKCKTSKISIHLGSLRFSLSIFPPELMLMFSQRRKIYQQKWKTRNTIFEWQLVTFTQGM